MAEPLTDRQRTVLRYVYRFHAEHGYAPSLAQIAFGLQVHRSTAQGHVDALQARVYLLREPGRPLAPPDGAWPDAGACVEFTEEFANVARCVTARPWSILYRRARRALGEVKHGTDRATTADH
jgi:hypothetical protein